jgi:hypothetical protein
MPLYKHGGSYTSEYKSWSSMKDRCLCITNKDYRNYGARGITICVRWVNSFENFLEDMGKKPAPEYSIDRKDNNGNYEPGNCRWATKSEQSLSRRKREFCKRGHRFETDGYYIRQGGRLCKPCRLNSKRKHKCLT